MKVALIIATRPDAIKMMPLALRLKQKESGFSPIIISTGQHKDLLEHGLKCFGIAPDVDLALMRDNDNLQNMTGRMIPAIAKVLEREKPHIVLVHGDTTSAFSAALASFYTKIPVGHVEAGLTTGNKDAPYPEEMNRRLISRIAEIHFAPTISAKSNLVRSGVTEKDIAVTGNTIIDAIQYIERRFPIEESTKNGEEKTVLVTCHRREKTLPDYEVIYDAMLLIAEKADVTFILHHRKAQRSFFLQRQEKHPRIKIIEPVEYADFITMIKRSDVILTDSGGIQEEAAYFQKPIVVLRNETEREEILSSPYAALSILEPKAIYDCVSGFLEARDAPSLARTSCVFGDGAASTRIAEALHNWKKGIALLPPDKEFGNRN